MENTDNIIVEQNDGYKTKLVHFCCSKKPKASILILHGMAEHKERYNEFALFLTEQGYDVYYYDHRGHGIDKKLNELGFFASSKGYQLVVDDAITVSSYIEANNRCNKLYLLGHSMGSFIARNVVQKYDKYNGLVLIGSAYPPKLVMIGGLLISSLIIKFKGPRYISPYLNNILFSGKKYTRLSERTAFDWLSRSHPIVGAYINDPYCGFICSASFYHDLIKLISNASKKKLIQNCRKDLPINIISGENDPVGNYGKDIVHLGADYRKLGLANVSVKLYPECRHELLNELNKEEIYSDINLWIAKHI